MRAEPSQGAASLHQLGSSINYYLQTTTKTLLIVRFLARSKISLHILLLDTGFTRGSCVCAAESLLRYLLAHGGAGYAAGAVEPASSWKRFRSSARRV